MTSGMTQEQRRMDSWRLNSTRFMLKLLAVVFSQLETVNTALQKQTLTLDQTENMIAGVKDSLKWASGRIWSVLEQAVQSSWAPHWWTIYSNTKKRLLADTTVGPSHAHFLWGHISTMVPRGNTSSEDMDRQRFHDAVDAVHCSLSERYPLSRWQPMAHIARFLTDEGDHKYLSVYCNWFWAEVPSASPLYAHWYCEATQ